MMKLAKVKETLRNGPYTWPGCYPLFFITTDGEPLSFEAVRKHWRDVCEAHIKTGWSRSGWAIAGVDVNYEDEDLFCCETGKRIESAYGEDATEIQA